MIRRRFLVGAAAVTLVVAGCDGGDDDASPTPTPSGSSSATPTPTPSPTYAEFPLEAASEFYAINAATNYSGDLAGGPVSLGVAGSEGNSDQRVRLAVQTTIGTSEFVIREAAEESRYTSTNQLTGSSAGVTEYVFRTSDAATGEFSQTEYLNNTIKGSVTSDAALAREQVSYANWWRGDSTTGQKRLTYTIWGYPTFTSDMPTTGSATYTSRVTARMVRASIGGNGGTIAKLGGTVTLTVNYATGAVALTLNLTDGATTVGTYTGTGAVAAGANRFSGSFSGASPLAGTFNGGFFGSQGAEVGIAFALTGAVAGVEQRAVGVVVGAK
jgi:hypothetical protein